MSTTIFEKIVKRELEADIVFQDDRVTAFRDIAPLAPVHILIIPNICIPTACDVETYHESTLGYMFTVARKIAQQEGINQRGFRLIINCKEDGGQEVYHLHMHLLGGKNLGKCLPNAD